MQILTFLGAVIFSIAIRVILKSNNDKKKSAESAHYKVSAHDFVDHLEQLGYFKYTNKEGVGFLKSEIIKYYDPDSELISIWNDTTNTPWDCRNYLCDGEAVFELGGIKALLDELSLAFDKFGFKCVVTNHMETWDAARHELNHSITLNDTNYILFENFKETGWGEAVLKIAQALNKELAKQSIDERIYLASGGNDGRLIFLTNDLYEYIYKVYRNRKLKPLDIHEWAVEMEVVQ